MGSNTSKPTSEAAGFTQKTDSDIGANSDPRSPTPEIIRTPLQDKTASKHNITKNVDLRKTFENAKSEEKLIHNNPILSAVIKNHLQSYDPRSPTHEFERTPIIISSKIDELGNDNTVLNLQNESYGSPCLNNDENDDNYDSCAEVQECLDLVVPKNLCNGFFDMTLNDTIKETDGPLGSSTASNDTIGNDMSKECTGKPVQLLETNFDYVETNIDEFEDSKESNEKIGDPDQIPLFKILDDDPRSPSIGIERTPIVVAKIKQDSAEDNVEEMSDDSLIKVLQSTNAELRQTSTNPHDNPEGLLIFEDEATQLNDTPKKSKSDSSSASRTPLSCMKNKSEAGHARSKSANTLNDPKGITSKVSKRVSHIPRLKSLSKQTRLNLSGSSISLKTMSKTLAISCENTPPHSHRDMWDADNSLVL